MTDQHSAMDPYDEGMRVEVLLHTAVYAGVPAANSALKIARAVLEEEGAL